MMKTKRERIREELLQIVDDILRDDPALVKRIIKVARLMIVKTSRIGQGRKAQEAKR